tara:strand:+ start:8890 stop:10326 length:1437 start_codon:yes stop_codon:yes gene_type:complete
MNFFKNIFYILLVLSINPRVYGQNVYNWSFHSKILDESKSFSKSSTRRNSSNILILKYLQKNYLNTNLPNFENMDGIYLPKGYGQIHSTLLYYKNKFLLFSIEPQFKIFKSFSYNLTPKESSFSKLNDVPIFSENKSNLLNPKNINLSINSSGLRFGFSNINRWWGPGIHNSLAMSSNSKGIPKIYFSFNKNINNNSTFNFNHYTSKSIKNELGENFYITSSSLEFSLKEYSIGVIKHILSGSRNSISWSLLDAMTVTFTERNAKYWDYLNSYYFSAKYPQSNMIIFLEYGYPKRSFGSQDQFPYLTDHSIGTNIGLRQYNAFGFKNLTYGIEYSRLVQSSYFNILPSPNWYDNKIFDYHSFKGRFWGSHAGSDSDDLFLYIGYLKNNINLISALNYERHGVTFHFPPEVKIEFQLSLSIILKNNFSINIFYENEKFNHYAFLNNNANVWSEDFEEGSIQRTKTVLISIEKLISFYNL